MKEIRLGTSLSEVQCYVYEESGEFSNSVISNCCFLSFVKGEVADVTRSKQASTEPKISIVQTI